MTAMPDAAATFHRLHQGRGLLRLANAWDAGSARLMESVGAKAIATTSAGVAWSLGHPDGDAMPLAPLVAAVSAIARVIRVPLSVDMEGGYAADAAGVGDSVGQIVDAGGVGINIEDGTDTPDLLCAKIAAAKEAASRRGIDLFVNARTDVYLRGLAPEDARVAESLSRAERYRAAGADGLFVPGVTAAEEIRDIAAGAGLPLNVLARPGLPDAAALERLGVRRLSAGSGIVLAALGRAATLAAAFLEDGRSEPLVEGAKSYAEMNVLTQPR